MPFAVFTSSYIIIFIQIYLYVRRAFTHRSTKSDIDNQLQLYYGSEGTELGDHQKTSRTTVMTYQDATLP